MNDESLTPAEARAAELLSELREARPPQHRDLPVVVTQHARWQRQLRHVLVSVGDAAGSVAGGLLHVIRGRR